MNPITNLSGVPIDTGEEGPAMCVWTLAPAAAALALALVHRDPNPLPNPLPGTGLVVQPAFCEI